MAVFLFVLIIAPMNVYASGDSVSENYGSDDEYTDWSEALSDSEYTDNLADILAKYWASTWSNYVGYGSDVVEDVASLLGNQYDATKDLYENLYPFVLPFATQTVSNIVPADIPASYGHPKRNENNLALVQSLGTDLYTLLNTQTNDGFDNITKDKSNNSSMVTPSGFPSWFHIVYNFPAGNLPSYRNNYASEGLPCILYVNKDAPALQIYYYYMYPFPNTYEYVMCYVNAGNGMSFGCTFYDSYGNQVTSPRDYYYNYRGVMNREDLTFTNTYTADMTSVVGNVYYYGSGYISINQNNQVLTYFWDANSKTLYFLGSGLATNYFGTTSSNDIVGNYTINVINSVDFDDYTDLINQLMLDVNMSNDITNSLLLELLLELRSQRNNFVQDDDSDIYDYIDYIMQKLIEVKDVHIEIPDISPDLGGIADALTALLNFLASIIRAISNIVSSLLEGLFHLFVPTENDWDEINLQFDTLSSPLSINSEIQDRGDDNVSNCKFISSQSFSVGTKR